MMVMMMMIACEIIKMLVVTHAIKIITIMVTAQEMMTISTFNYSSFDE